MSEEGGTKTGPPGGGARIFSKETVTPSCQARSQVKPGPRAALRWARETVRGQERFGRWWAEGMGEARPIGDIGKLVVE